MNRAALSRQPAQNKALEIMSLVYEVARVAIVRELSVRFNLPLFGLQIGDEPAQIRKPHLLRFVGQFFKRSRKVHYSKLRSRTILNQAVRFVPVLLFVLGAQDYNPVTVFNRR